MTQWFERHIISSNPQKATKHDKTHLVLQHRYHIVDFVIEASEPAISLSAERDWDDESRRLASLLQQNSTRDRIE